MKKTIALLMCISVALLVPIRPVCADTLTFEDLLSQCDAHPGQYSDIYGMQTAYGYAIPDGYAGLSWDHFCALDAPKHAAFFHKASSGEVNGLVSGSVVVYNAYAMTSSIMKSASPLTVHSAYLTGAWKDGLTVTAEGYLNGALKYSKTVVVSYYRPTFVSYEFANIDKMVWNSSYNGVSENGMQFAMDNLSLDFVPEPSSIITLLCGVSAIGGLVWKKNSA